MSDDGDLSTKRIELMFDLIESSVLNTVFIQERMVIARDELAALKSAACGARGVDAGLLKSTASKLRFIRDSIAKCEQVGWHRPDLEEIGFALARIDAELGRLNDGS